MHSRERARKSVSNIAQPPNRIYEGNRNYVRDIFGMTGRPRNNVAIEHSRFLFTVKIPCDKKLRFLRKKRKKKKRNDLSLLSGSPKSADTIQE